MVRVASRTLGFHGERLAVAFLRRRGVRVVDTNVFVDRDEIDIIYRGSRGLVAIEVKTVTAGVEPFEALTDEKMRRLRRAIAGYEKPIVALDAIGVTIGGSGTEIRWLRGIG
ncbi:MAG: YraN family protein [Actinomycetia bacterium]|nr:YraN family protein [Actinomycetes bacterium]